MAQTVVGFFKNMSDVQKALQRLESKGIPKQQVDISKGRHLDGTVDPDGRNTNKITDFFNKLFGHDSDDARLYSTIGQTDVHIVTVHASSGDLAEKASDILDDCGAIDVDEHRSSTNDTFSDRGKAASNSNTDRETNAFNDSNLQRDSSRSSKDIPGRDKSLSHRDDYANTLSTDNPIRDVNEPTNPFDDSVVDRGPGMRDRNSNYIEERSYPDDLGDSTNDNISNRDTDVNMRNPIEESGNRDRSIGNMGAGSNDDYARSGDRQAGLNNELGTRSAGTSFTGEDMTNDRISSPDDDQRTIDQNNPARERRNTISEQETPGLENRIPSAEEQLNRARRKSRIINASIEDDYRLRDI